jgi:hypothetical protein
MDINKQSKNISIKLLDSEDNIIYNDTLASIDTEILKTQTIGVKETLNYTVIIEYNGDHDDYGLTADLLVYKESSKKDNKMLGSLILNDNNLQNLKTEIGQISTENEGLIRLVEDSKSTYYFRGNVDTNYVSFAGFIWRVVKINDDYSVKLILDDIIDKRTAYKQSIISSEYIYSIPSIK